MDHVASVDDNVSDDQLLMENQVLVTNVVMLHAPWLWGRYGLELEKIGAEKEERSLAKVRDAMLMHQRDIESSNFWPDRLTTPGDDLELEGYIGFEEGENLRLQGQALLDMAATEMMVFDRFQPESTGTKFQNDPAQLPLPVLYQDTLAIYIPRMVGAVPDVEMDAYYESVFQATDSEIQAPWEKVVFDGHIYDQPIRDSFTTFDGHLFFLFSRNTNVLRMIVTGGSPACLVCCTYVETMYHPVIYREDDRTIIQFKCVEDGYPGLLTLYIMDFETAKLLYTNLLHLFHEWSQFFLS